MKDKIVTEPKQTPDILPDMLGADHTAQARPSTPTTETPRPTSQVVASSGAHPLLNYVVIAVTFLVVGGVIAHNIFGMTDTSATASDDLRDVIRAVLIEEGLIQDMQVLADDDPYIGDEDAPIVIVEFSAYACPYCGRHFQETFQPLLENYGEHIRYVFRDYPIINPQVSYQSSIAANCALAQGQFWEMHEAIFANQNRIDENQFFYETAEELGLDVAAFTECYDNQRYLDEIEGDMRAGRELEISGTPAFYINSRQVSGALPYEYFEELIQEELDQLGIPY